MTRYYDDHIIEEIESRIDIVDVISETVHLTRKGNRYWGICPFHAEKTPSFSVSAEKKMFYCFGCHTGGNMFSFVMKRDGVDFKEAVQGLAAKAGVKIIKADHRKESKKAGVLTINKAACEFFQQYLQGEHGLEARQYLDRRRVSASSIEQFKLGMAPDGWDGLEKYLLKKGFSHDDVQLSGLIKRNENRNSYYDIFRHRLMFPIFNPSGEIIGFGGRVLDETMPKYLNTAETDVFAKRRNLYGLYQGREQIRQANEAILVEGYMDCIMLHQAGIKNAVASLGTAFTSEQARLILRYAENVLILYDGDEAGQRETQKAIEVLNEQGIKIFVASLPEGMDPDDFLNQYGKEEFSDYIKNNRISHIEFKIDRYLRLMPDLNMQNKIKIINLLKEDINRLKSELEKDYQIKNLARKLMIEENIIYREYKPQSRYSQSEGISKNKTEIIRNNIKYGNYSLEEKIMAAIIEDHDHLQEIKSRIGLDCFTQPELNQLADYYDQLPGDPSVKQSELKMWAIEQGLDDILARILLLLGERYINEIEINNFIRDFKRRKEQLFWQELQGELNNLSDHGDFNNLLKFILDFDTSWQNFQEGGKA